MGFYQLRKTQKLTAKVDEIWELISSPAKLKTITPEYMGFNIISGTPAEKMYPGMIIAYHVSPVLKRKLTWVTEITHVLKNTYFVDEQRLGPYKFWHHEHFIEAIEGGVLMTDIVSYKPPFGIFGAIANKLFIKNQLEKIFNYRQKSLEKIFGIYEVQNQQISL